MTNFRDLDKEYVATIHLGETTPSYDLETEINERFPVEHITENLVISALNGFPWGTEAGTSHSFSQDD